jgi:hypothetical protein
MQIDIESEGSWLTEITPPDQCPLCNKPITITSSKGLPGIFTCHSCGYGRDQSGPYGSLPTGASVWIDPAVYAPPIEASSSAHKVPGGVHQQQPKFSSHSKKQPNPITPIPPHSLVQRPANGQTAPGSAKQPASTVWEYESENYAVGTSLPSLSLMVPETPTQPQFTSSSPTRETRRLPRIDEIDTTPPSAQPLKQSLSARHQPVSPRLDEVEIAQLSPVLSRLEPQPSIDQINTLPDVYIGVGRKASTPPSALILPNETTRALVPRAHRTAMVEGDTASWTAGSAANSSYAQLIVNPREHKRKRYNTLTLNPLDRVRWWLLHPGRIEFMLWLFGTILLITVTCSLLLLTASSLNWLSPTLPGGITSSRGVNAPADSGARTLSTVATTPALSLVLLDKGPFLPGQPVHLHGQGFSHHGRIAFSYKGGQSLLGQNGQAFTTQADAHGAFSVTIWPGEGSAWHTGHNIIIARDLNTNHFASVDVVLGTAPIGKTVPTMPAPATTPGATPTGTHGGTGGGTLPTPVGQTPVPVTPTVTDTPSPVPSPSPTQVPPSPIPTSTVGTTPTPTGTPRGNPSPSIGINHSNSSSLGNNLSSGSSNSSLASHGAGFNPLVPLMISCYALAFVLLGVAGVLHRRKR